MAQSADAEAEASDSYGDIVVTARRREESLQEVPLTITALSEEQLQRTGTSSLADLATQTPGLAFQDSNGAFQAPVIRGVAQVDQVGAQGNVGVFVDGVYLNNRSGLEFGLMDIARIEVVKGPQSALYGRNTFAGAINYVTRAPSTKEFGGTFIGEIGDYGRRKISASLNVPLVQDMLAVRLFGGYAKFDGTILNERDGENIGGYDHRYTFGGTVLFQPTPELSIKLFASHTDQENDQGPLVGMPSIANNCGSQVVRSGVTYNTLLCGELPKFTSVNMDTNIGYGLRGDSDLFYGTATYDFGGAALTALVSHTKAGFSSLIDTTADPTAINTPAGTRSRQQFTNSVGDASKETAVDIRLDSTGSGPLQWTIGAYFFDSNVSDILELSGQPVGQPNSTPVAFSQRGGILDTKGWAIYGSAAFKFSDAFNAQLELRYNDEKQDFSGRGTAAAARGSNDYKFLTPRLTLNYQLDGALVYASAARGYKTGGFNSNAFGLPQFIYEAETNWTYELGMKTNPVRGLQLNGAAFYIDWNDLQAQVQIPSSTLNVVQNNGGARSVGVELDATYNFTPDLFLRVSGTKLRPTYKDDVLDGEVAAPCGDITGSQIAVRGCSYAVGGNQLSRTTDFQFAINAGYTARDIVPGVNAYIRGDYSYQASKFSDSLNFQRQGDIELANARIGIEPAAGVDISLWVKNLFDYKYNARATVVGSVADGSPLSGITYTRVYPGERRTWGLTGSYRF
ncbi:TonB-dependent receptor [Sphingomonas sp. HF-S4]|uniref:TonB-dependent receptor n=1 Tax=Sphingomonas agrestis TaxID=3080540 RepID=A0ABU3Y3Y6_9SPHN|nr:TonB-dependent receptor [Sphingomonas sp. HF-S4]MDV3456106.1 TonB-dependent receptor [Sphingomonas sp. HF-S4]